MAEDPAAPAAAISSRGRCACWRESPRLARAIVEALDREGNEAFLRDYDYYLVKWREPFLSRRRKIGWAGRARGVRDLRGIRGLSPEA